nr:ATP/GTP-binding protein [Streptomyces aureus]
MSASADNGLKIVVVGGFGVGKTTLVRSVSEIRPLNTEETMTQAGEAVDDISEVRGKSATTVAFDFGRITLDTHNILYLFGAPGQERFWFLWDRLFSGTLGAIVLVDTRRIDESWYAIDRLEHHGTPFIVACNDFGGPPHTPAQIREALDLDPHVPLLDCDARSRESSKRVLITLVEHLQSLYTRHGAAAAEGALHSPEPVL